MSGSRVAHLAALVALAASVGAGAFGCSRRGRWDTALPAPLTSTLSSREYEQWARHEFRKHHPHAKPLNWEIAAKAVEFHRRQPMGRFVLDKNDCSDFVDAIMDDALGARARFRRHSRDHILARERVWDTYYWDRRTPLQPGDELLVRHSPWYGPYESRLWHIGVIGTDGQVYDWTKLRSWSEAQYGRNSVEWFTRNSPGRDEIAVVRLAPEYRYCIRPLPLR
jgi:hypothetical protein